MTLPGRLAVLAAVLVLGSGCQVTGQDQSDASLAANRDRATELGDRWRSLPGVTDVDVRYVDDLDNSPGLTTTIRCRGCDVGALADDVTGDVWASALDPLVTFRVRVYDEEDAARRVVDSYVLPDDEDALTQRYGAR